LLEALEKLSRKRVNADDASYSKNYICPECNMPVDLRAGNVRSAYFAHAHGVSNEDCQLYAAGQLGGGGYATQTQDDEEQLFRLFLKIGCVRGQYTWGLELSVPTGRQSHGSITLDVGGGVSEINLAGNIAPHRMVTIEPQAEPYRIIEVTPKFGPLWNVNRECLGLNPKFATVFGDISVLGNKNYPIAKQLRAERAYAFIWNAEIKPDFPDELTVKQLAARPGWLGAIVDIPHTPTQQCQDWLTNFSNLQFSSATPAILPVWPPLVRAITSRIIEAQPNLTMILFVEHPSSSEVPPVFARSNNSERVARAALSNAPFYILTPERSPNVRLVCRKTEGLEIDIDFNLKEVDIKPVINNAVLLYGVSKEGVKSSVALHNENAISWLNRVRDGEIKFLGIAFPIGLIGFVSAVRDFKAIERLEVGGEFISRISVDSHISSDADKASKFSSWLLDRSIDAHIDFGGFGRAVVLGVPKQVSIKKLRHSSIIKIEHFFRRFPDCARLKRNWRTLSGPELCVEFRNIKPKKNAVILHRLIALQLMRNHD